MGQNISKPAEPELSPSDLKAKEFADAVRNTAPVPFLRDPLPTAPRDSQHPNAPETLWGDVLAAEGRDNLDRAVEKFLKHCSVEDLLANVAQENNETESAAQERFVLRYGEEDDLQMSATGWQQARLLSAMLQDELDLPGFRLGTALRRWRKVVARYSKLHRLDEEGLAMARNSIFAFLHDHGVGRLVDCLQEDHASELGVQEALSAIVDVDATTGERILYAPSLMREHPVPYHQRIATNVRDWLIGEGQLSFDRFETGSTPTRAAWAGCCDSEPIPADKDASLESVVEGARMSAWNVVYVRGLRHMDLFGIEDFVEGFLESLQLVRAAEYERWMARNADEWLANGRRQKPVERLAAVAADCMIATVRRKRRAAINRTSRAKKSKSGPSDDPPALQTHLLDKEDVQDPTHASPASWTGLKRTPSPTLGPVQGDEQEDSDDELYRLTPSRKQKGKQKAWDDLFTDDARYNELLEKNTDLLVTQAELEETIRYLMEDIEELHAQLDEDVQSQKPRVCRICSLHLTDEEAERLHMAKHRDELNKCREKNGLSPYGIDLSSAGGKKKGGKSSSSSSTASPSTRISPGGYQGPPTYPIEGRKSPTMRKAPLFEDTVTTPDPDPQIGLSISFGSSPRSSGSKNKRSTPPTSPAPPVVPDSSPRPGSARRSSSKPSKHQQSASPKQRTPSPKATKKVLKAVEVPVDPLIADGDEILSDIVVQQPAAPRRGTKRKEPSALMEFLNTRGQTVKRRKR